jgi:hypothetical protein
MKTFEDELQYEIGWRVNEISVIRSIPLHSNLKKYQKDIIIKYSVPAIYALWEGFVIASLSLYINEINRLNINFKDINCSLRTHDIDVKYQLSDARVHFIKKIKLIDKLYNYLTNPIILNSRVPTDKNFDFGRTNLILGRLNVSLMDKKYENQLNRLVLFRNDIAHGEFSIPINSDVVTELSLTVINSMSDLTFNIVEAYNNKSFLQII